VSPLGGPEYFDEIDVDPVSAHIGGLVVRPNQGSKFWDLTPHNFGTPYPNHIEFILKSACEKQIFPMVKVWNRSECV